MTPPAGAGVARPELVAEQIPAPRPGWLRMVTSSDHKLIGRMYIATSLMFLTATITLLFLMRLQLIVPDSTIIRPEIFDQLLSTYGVTAVLMFAIPLFLGLMSYIVPLQIGARGVALPRLGALSYWLYLLGTVTIYASFLYTPSEAGTLALPPLSDNLFSLGHGVDTWALGVALICLGFTFFAINQIVTLHNNRAPGMVWRRVPLFSIGSAIVSWVLIVVGPIMIATLTMLLIDRNFSGIFFEAGQGGAPLLYQHLAWVFFTGIYVSVIVAAMGAISEIFATFSRQPQFGQRTIAAAMAAFALIGVLAWMQNMYSAPIRIGFLYFAMLMAVSLIVPVGLILFNWIGTVRGGSVSMRPPMLFAAGGVVLLTIGLAGEWAQSVIPVSWQVANTGVAWGDTHFALIGAGLLGGFAALYYWFPKMTGRFMGDSLARGSFWLIAVGAVLMIVPVQLAGLEGMPVDVYKYFEGTGMSTYNLIASIGAFILVGGVLLSLINAVASRNGGALAGHDPWGGSSLEWFALSPPHPHNFDLVPDVRSNEAYDDIRDAVRRNSTLVELPAAAAADVAEPPAAPAPTPGPTDPVPEPGAADESPMGDYAGDEGDGPVA